MWNLSLKHVVLFAKYSLSQYREKPPSSETDGPENKQSCQCLVILLHMLEVTGLKLSPENSS
jgi:hypothetical protein